MASPSTVITMGLGGTPSDVLLLGYGVGAAVPTPEPQPSPAPTPGGGGNAVGWHGPRVPHPTWWRDHVEQTPDRQSRVVQTRLPGHFASARSSFRAGRVGVGAPALRWHAHRPARRQTFAGSLAAGASFRCRTSARQTRTAYWHALYAHRGDARHSFRAGRKPRPPLTAAQRRLRAALLGEGMPLGGAGVCPADAGADTIG